MMEKMVRVQYLALMRAMELQEGFGFQNTYCGEYWYREHGMAMDSAMDSVTHDGKVDGEYAKLRNSGEIEKELDVGSQSDCLCVYADFWLVRHYIFHFFNAGESEKIGNIVKITLAKKNSASDWKIVSESGVNEIGVND